MHLKHVVYLLLTTTLLVGCDRTNSPLVSTKRDTPKPKPIDITFDDVQLDIKTDEVFVESMLTDRVRELVGKHVRIRGFIVAESTYEQTGIQQFMLIKNNQCKYGAGGEFHHTMAVQLKPEDAIDFTVRPVTVEGKLSLAPWTGPNGKTWAIYRLDG